MSMSCRKTTCHLKRTRTLLNQSSKCPSQDPSLCPSTPLPQAPRGLIPWTGETPIPRQPGNKTSSSTARWRSQEEWQRLLHIGETERSILPDAIRHEMCWLQKNSLETTFTCSAARDSRCQGPADLSCHALPSVAALLTASKPCLLYTSPSPRDRTRSRMPSSA